MANIKKFSVRQIYPDYATEKDIRRLKEHLETEVVLAAWKAGYFVESIDLTEEDLLVGDSAHFTTKLLTAEAMAKRRPS